MVCRVFLFVYAFPEWIWVLLIFLLIFCLWLLLSCIVIAWYLWGKTFAIKPKCITLILQLGGDLKTTNVNIFFKDHSNTFNENKNNNQQSNCHQLKSMKLKLGFKMELSVELDLKLGLQLELILILGLCEPLFVEGDEVIDFLSLANYQTKWNNNNSDIQNLILEKSMSSCLEKWVQCISQSSCICICLGYVCVYCLLAYQNVLQYISNVQLTKTWWQ